MRLGAILERISREMAAETQRGEVAHYIPPLAKVDPAQFAIAVYSANGGFFGSGALDTPFSVQSISKIFTLTLALQEEDGQLWKRVRQEPSGSPFNSIVQLESEHGIPRNPLINAGAIVVADTLVSRYGPKAARNALLDLVRPLASNPDAITFSHEMAQEEAKTGFRNIALANYMRNFGNINNSVDDTLDLYFHQCAMMMSCRQLAYIGAYLMRDGTDLSGKRRLSSARNTRRILGLMMMCGHYDASGAFAIRVGLPGKSGVGGGILAIAPGIASIAVWSPGLSREGNSLLGTLALERLVQETGWSVFNPATSAAPSTLV